MVSLTFYDGVDCIGGNKILLADEDCRTSLFFDFGTNFEIEGQFFDEFLAPRVAFGFHDLLALGILPPLQGLYRCDLEYPGVWEKYASSSLYRTVGVQGILLSHAHLDHCGYLSYLREDVPIITNVTSALICKVLQDTGSGNRLQELCYLNSRELKDGLLQPGPYKSTPFRQRKYKILGKNALSEYLHSFWKKVYLSRELYSCPLEPCQREGEEMEVGDLMVRMWSVDHSIPGAVAFGVRTSSGWIVYTGDLRLHGRNASLTRRFFEEAQALEPLILICEGTHPEVEKPCTEGEVAEESFRIVAKTQGLVVADFGPRNVERLLSFLEVARQTGRRLVLTAKDVYLLETLARVEESDVPDPHSEEHFVLYRRPKTRERGWEEALFERFDPARVVEAKDIKKNPKEYILCFSYYDFHAFLDIEPQGGTYIYSSSEAYNEEMLLDHNRVKNWIDYFGFELYGTLGEDRERSGFHASGHLHGPGIREMVETIRPKILAPVHTENREFFRQFEGLCRVVWLERGEMITC